MVYEEWEKYAVLPKSARIFLQKEEALISEEMNPEPIKNSNSDS